MGFGYGNFSTIGGESSIMAFGRSAKKQAKIEKENKAKEKEFLKKHPDPKSKEGREKRGKRKTEEELKERRKKFDIQNEKKVQQKEERPEKPTINLTPTKNPQVAPNEQGVIDLTKQGQPEEEKFGLKEATKAAAIGAAIGTGAFIFGAAVIAEGGVAASTVAVARGLQITFRTISTKFLTYSPQVGGTIIRRNGVMRLANRGFINVANNSKNFMLKKSFLTKLASTAKDPRVVLGILASTLYTSLFWAPNEKGDALTTLTIAQRDALRNGNTEGVFEINNLIQETLEISASIPVIGFMKAEIAKFKAAAKASEISAKAAEKMADEQIRMKEQGESDFAKERRESDEAAFDRKREFREEESAKFDDIQKENEKRDEDKRDQDKQDREERDAEDLKRKEEDEKEARIKQEVWRLRREAQQTGDVVKRNQLYEKADALELTLFN